MKAIDVFFQLSIGASDCPSESDLKKLRSAALSAVSFAQGSRAHVVCVRDIGRTTRTVKVGIWANPGNASDEELRESLFAYSVLDSGSGQGLVAMFLSTNVIQRVASAKWAEVSRTKIDAPVGFIRLSKSIQVTTGTRGITTRFSGTWKKRFWRNISFGVTITEQLDVATHEPQMYVSSRGTSVSSKDNHLANFLLSALSPTFGLIHFFAARKIRGQANTVAESQGGIGAALAQEWPDWFLTEVRPPLLKGKLDLQWNSPVEINQTRIQTRGTIWPISRTPSVRIEGKRDFDASPPQLQMRPVYRLAIDDLRRPLRYQWHVDGVAAGTSAEQTVTLSVSKAPEVDSKAVSVVVTDVDGLTANDQMTVHFRVSGRFNP